jgi:hypothetical protein
LRGPRLLAACLDIETRVVAWAIQRSITWVVRERKSLVRTSGGEADDVAVRPDARWDARAELDQDAGRITIWIGYVQRLIEL